MRRLDIEAKCTSDCLRSRATSFTLGVFGNYFVVDILIDYLFKLTKTDDHHQIMTHDRTSMTPNQKKSLLLGLGLYNLELVCLVTIDAKDRIIVQRSSMAI